LQAAIIRVFEPKRSSSVAKIVLVQLALRRDA